jgi:hypothetical protein
MTIHYEMLSIRLYHYEMLSIRLYHYEMLSIRLYHYEMLSITDMLVIVDLDNYIIIFIII